MPIMPVFIAGTFKTDMGVAAMTHAKLKTLEKDMSHFDVIICLLHKKSISHMDNGHEGEGVLIL